MMFRRAAADQSLDFNQSESTQQESANLAAAGAEIDVERLPRSREKKAPCLDQRCKHTMLLISSDSTVNEWTQDYCDVLGWTMHYASDGLDGLTMAFKRPYDAILLGRDLTTITPFILAEMLRGCPGKNDSTPMLFVGENPSADEKKTCKGLRVGLIETPSVLLSDFRNIIHKLV